MMTLIQMAEKELNLKGQIEYLQDEIMWRESELNDLYELMLERERADD